MPWTAYVGTSGFAYGGWAPLFYPEGTKSKDLLREYAKRLASVEVNYTFNALPSEKVIAGWLEATPASFRFALKASRRITHEGQLRDFEALTRFLDRARSLGERLGCVLFQTPPWLRRDDERLREFLAALAHQDVRAAFEFRHESWYAPEVMELLRGHDVALVTAEGERAPAPYTVTARFVYARLRRKDAAYDEAALAEWRTRAEETLASGRDAYLYLYHDETGENALAAERLATLLA